MPAFTASVNAMGALNVFEAVKSTCSNAKVYQASSSEMFGLVLIAIIIKEKVLQCILLVLMAVQNYIYSIVGTIEKPITCYLK